MKSSDSCGGANRFTRDAPQHVRLNTLNLVPIADQRCCVNCRLNDLRRLGIIGQVTHDNLASTIPNSMCCFNKPVVKFVPMAIPIANPEVRLRILPVSHGKRCRSGRTVPSPLRGIEKREPHPKKTPSRLHRSVDHKSSLCQPHEAVSFWVPIASRLIGDVFQAHMVRVQVACRSGLLQDFR